MPTKNAIANAVPAAKSGGGGGAPPPMPLGVGDWFIVGEGLPSAPIDAYDDEGWTLTTRWLDVGAGDETTWEGSSGGNNRYVRGVRVLGATIVALSWIIKVFAEQAGVTVWTSPDGLVWTSWGLPSLPSGFSHAWASIFDDPADRPGTLYVQFLATDISSVDLPADCRVGDFRVAV